jgi:succinoglycan biosynthesis transport protein ExoP
MASSTALKLPASAAQFSPLSIIRMLWLHKLAIVVIWLLVSAITAALVYLLPAQYSAEVQILVDPQKIPERMVQSMVTTNVQDRLATISAQILSAPQLQKVIDDFQLYKKERKDHIQEEILQMMRKAIVVKLDKGWTNNQPGAFRVAYTGDEPAIVAQVANRVANLFIEENMRTRETQVEGTSEFLDTLLQEAKKRLDESEVAISSYKLKHNGELPEQVAAIAGNLARIQTEQNGNRDAIARAEQSKLTYQNTLELAESTLQTLLDRFNVPPTPVAAVDPSSIDTDDPPPALPTPTPPAPKPIRGSKASEVLENQLLALRANGFGDAHPDVKRLKLAIAAAKEAEARAEQEAANAPPAPIPVPAPAPQASKRVGVAPTAPPPAPAGERPEIVQAREHVRAIKTQMELIDKEIATRTADLDRLSQAVSEAQARLTNVPVREQEIAQILRDHASFQGDYQSLLGKVSAARISSDMELRQKSERFAINDPARVPGKPVSPDRISLNFLGSLAGLALGFCAAFGQEFRKGRLLGAWELPEEALVLARVPQISPFRSDPGRGLWARWSRMRRLAVVSCVLLPLLGLLAVVRVYLVR